MACGEFGPGRMSEPLEIIEAIDGLLETGAGPLAGHRALVTSGPTWEALDPVRYIANRSSGKQGHAIAAALAAAGADTVLVSGPVSIPEPPGVRVVSVESAREMLAACERALPADIAVCAAAVADWRAAGAADQKMKKDGSGAPPALALTENPDILHTLSGLADKRPALVVGFAAETQNVIDYASAKRQRKGCDWIVANDVGAGTAVMGGDSNSVHIIDADGVESWSRMDKSEVARRLVARIATRFEAGGGADD